MSPSISILTVTYGNRFQYLKQVITACLRDENLTELIIVDNASQHQKEIEEEINKYSNKKIKYIRLEENTGSAGGFATGMEYFLSTNNDYLLLLDDDNVPEENFLKYYLNTLFLFEKPEEVVLVGNRRRIQGYEKRFLINLKLDKNSFVGVNLFNHIKMHTFLPIRNSEIFGYGGTFLSKKIILSSGLPDKRFFVYTDDIEFSYRIYKKGLKIFNVYRPFIEDVDVHNKDSGILSIFSPKVDIFRIKRSFYNDAEFISSVSRNLFIYFLNFIIYIIYLFLLLIKNKKMNNNSWFKLKTIIKYTFKGFLNKPFP